MKKLFIFILFLIAVASNAQAGPLVVMQTSMGSIKLELYEDKAPISVANFLDYVDQNFYDGSVFHRVIADFMIQGGGFTQNLQRKTAMAPIKNEATNGLKNTKGTIAMARTNVVDSATSQFFINLKDNDFLNHRGQNPRQYGYAVFGKVIEGMDVVEKIAKQKTIAKNRLFQNLPEPVVVIESVRRVSE